MEDKDNAYAYFAWGLAVADYLNGEAGERSIEDFGRDKGLSDIATMIRNLRTRRDQLGKRTFYAWRLVGNALPGVGSKDVLAEGDWDVVKAYGLYMKHSERMAAMDRLRWKYESDYLAKGLEKPLYAMSQDLGARMWSMEHWMTFYDPVPKSLVTAIGRWDGESVNALAKLWREERADERH